MEEKDLEVHDEEGVSEDNSNKSTDETAKNAVKNEEANKPGQDDSETIENNIQKSEDIKEDKNKNEDKNKEVKPQKTKEDEAKNKESSLVESSENKESEKAKEDKAAKDSKKEDGKKEDSKKEDSNKAEKGFDKKGKKNKKKKSAKAQLVKKDSENESSDPDKNKDIKEVGKEEDKVKEETVAATDEKKDVAEEDIQKKKKRSKKRMLYAATITGLGLAVVYFAGVHYFKKRFLPNTTVNYTDASFKTIEELDATLQKPLALYSLEVVAREGERHLIKTGDVDLRYKLDKSIDSVLEDQEVYKWPMYFFKKNPHKVGVSVELDDAKLEFILSGYNCLTEENFKEARDAYIADYNNENGYVIEKEYNGTIIDIDKAKEKIRSSLIQLGFKEDLDADDLYRFAQIKQDNEKLLSTQEILNKHAGTVINYAGGAVLNGERISQWIAVDDAGNLILDENGIRIFVDELAERYDTLGKPRIFKTTDGREVEIIAKKYGWQIDKEGEFQAIRASILAGEQVDREPVFASRAASLEGNDFGNTYVEIDLGNQKLYYYADGQLALSTDIVSGALWGGRKTPPGLYRLNYKAKNVVLRGPDYAAPVRYWMPFNGGIGMHDASWRSSFGGGIYKSGGSHGCINMPTASAKALYDIINKDCPVVCYY